ncbi:MAG TPA: biotin carboxylase N-terminal domain-containing protein [Solirubrobacteraceae bacterium]
MFERVLIANRGEIVVRIARTLRRLGASAATVRARGDDALAHVRACDVAVEIDSYLDVDAVVEAALRCGAQAIHPGYGFLSERPELARACVAAGITWIGPPAEAIELMGDKVAARAFAAEQAGVPVLAGLERPAPEDVTAFAKEHGLPVLVKAAAGGGGKGMRLVTSPEQIGPALESAAREALAAFGDGTLLIERYLTPSRHLEVQVLADAHGTVVHLGERECSLQRRHQKVIEEAPSPVVDARLRALLGAEATSLARACGYVGAGTVEFVAHAEDPTEHYFLEMNTRLQVEHAVTETVYGIDLVEWQLRVAAGEALSHEVTTASAAGHALEARIYAEDPARGFLPATGTLVALRLPAGNGIRVDAGVAAGETVGSRYDPMIAKVVAHAGTREQALSRLRGALSETVVLGVRNNVGYLCELLDDPRVRAASFDTGLIERLPAPLELTGAGRAAIVALLAERFELRGERPEADAFVALGAFRLAGTAGPLPRRFALDAETSVEVALGGLTWSGPQANADANITGEAVQVELLSDQALTQGRRLCVAFDGEAGAWEVAREGERWWIAHDGRVWALAPQAREREVGVDRAGEIRAPMPGSVVAVHAVEGAAVTRGEVLMVIESMKMELQITAPYDGVLGALHVSAGDQVALDGVLASMAPAPLAEVAA